MDSKLQTIIMDHEGSIKQLSVQEETKNDDNSTIANLPMEIQEDILRRLTFKDLYYCRHVCKNWYNLLSNPTFLDTNQIKSPFTSFAVSYKNTIHMLANDKDGEVSYSVALEPRRLRTGYSHGKRRGHVELVGACNGLLCVARRYLADDCTIYVLNPLLEKLLTLPKPKKEEQVIQQAYGFGFSQASGQFKVLRIVTRKLQDGTLKSEGAVCTVSKDNAWRKIGDHAPYPYSGKFSSASLHGAIHWMVDDIQTTDYIYAFDVKEEKVRAVPPPPSLEKRKIWMSLGVFDDCLFVFDNFPKFHLDLWRMKDYGVVSSWTRVRIRTPHAEFFPIGYWSDEQILMASSRYGSLFYYDKRTRTWVQFKVLDHHNNEVIACDLGFHSPDYLGHRKMSENHNSD